MDEHDKGQLIFPTGGGVPTAIMDAKRVWRCCSLKYFLGIQLSYFVQLVGVHILIIFNHKTTQKKMRIEDDCSYVLMNMNIRCSKRFQSRGRQFNHPTEFSSPYIVFRQVILVTVILTSFPTSSRGQKLFFASKKPYGSSLKCFRSKMN